MSNVALGLYGIVLLLVLFLTGLEMAYCMMLVGLLGSVFLFMDYTAASTVVIKGLIDTFTQYSYTVIPLFILMGEFASNSNIAKRLYLGAHKWFGHIPGGLAMTTVAGATAFKAMCGSSLATVGTFSSLAMPEMDRYGYKKELSAGTIASVSTNRPGGKFLFISIAVHFRDGNRGKCRRCCGRGTADSLKSCSAAHR